MVQTEDDGSSNMNYDNEESVVKNVTRPESLCKKKHNRVAYHKAKEAIAAKSIGVAKLYCYTNPY